MEENTATAAVASPQPPDDGATQERHERRGDTVKEDARAILEAAIGLTSLFGGPASPTPKHQKKEEKEAGRGDERRAPQQQPEPWASKTKPKTTATKTSSSTNKRKEPAAAAAATTDPRQLSVPPPPRPFQGQQHDQLPFGVRPSGRGCKIGPSSTVHPAPFSQGGVSHAFTRFPAPAIGGGGGSKPEDNSAHLPLPKRQTTNHRLLASSSSSSSSSLLPPGETAHSGFAKQSSSQTTSTTTKATKTDTTDVKVIIPPTITNNMNITLNFPEILYEIVSDPANYHIACWLPHGKGFVIHDKQLFADHVLPRHFDGAKFTSFTRRLKRWNFERVPRGPEMGAYYNKHFQRDRPDMVPNMMYGIDSGEMREDGEEEGTRSPLTEGEASIEQTKKKKAEKTVERKKSKAEETSYDDAVVEAAMEVHRKQLREQQEERQQRQQQERIQRDREFQWRMEKVAMEKESVASFQEAKLREERDQEQKRHHQPPSRQNISCPENQKITPYNPSNYAVPITRPNHNQADHRHPMDIQIRNEIHNELQANLRHQQQHQQHSMHQFQRQSSKDSPGNRPKKQLYRKPQNGVLHTSQPGYKQPSRRKADVLKRKQQKEQHEQQERLQLQPPSRHGTSRTVTEQNSQHAVPSTQQYNPEDYLTMAKARRNMAEIQAPGMSMEMLHARRRESIASASSLGMSDIELLRRQHLNIISPPEGSEQQQCLNDIERQVLSEMNYPMLPTDNPRSSLYTGGGTSSGSVGSRMDFARSSRNNNDARGRSMSEDHWDGGHSTSSSPFLDNTHLQRNNHQHFLHKIMASSKTHEDIMMMAARDLQARGAGSADPQGQHLQQPHVEVPPCRRPGPQRRMPQQRLGTEEAHEEIIRMAARDLQSRVAGRGGGGGAQQSQRFQHQPRLAEAHQQHRPNPPQRRMPQHQQHRVDDEELMMMAARRDLQSRVNAGRVSQHSHHHRQEHSPLSPSRMQQAVRQASMLPSRSRHHELMLRELDEKVERETLLAEAAAAQAAAGAAGLRESLSDEDFSAMKRRNSRASAA